ncbi:hypothetical protein H4R20_001629 [Coemansia guatemalensis]|uniref:Peptidase A22B, signal peptide peptidase n=1 Tax=Coemansia guatemalensis TaxID=2761395 RepID=A0A9W8HWZ8_9FUNG|nr:hypothetical protein H4R20_001629 [Coemansia guatemalensis]
MSETELFAAYAAIGSMAIAPIYFGSFSSLDRLKSAHKKRERSEFAEYSDSEDEEEESEAVSAEDAYMFPVYGSLALFSLYMIFKYLNKEWVNFLLSGYFALLGVAALTQVTVRTVKGISGIKLPLYHLHLVHHTKTAFHVRFTNLHLVSMAASAVATAYYLWSKNWIISNFFGLAFSFSAITLIRLDSFRSGMIMLGGLFVYDVFWVFGTEVMVSVAKNFDAPIKVVFPKTLFPEDGGKLQFTMLGLGDIVVPGIFLALCLRFDRHQYLTRIGYQPDKTLPKALGGKHRGFGFPTPYFYACLAAYVGGLATTISVMHVFKAAQPALLYLSPACTFAVLLTAAARGEVKEAFAYTELTDEEEDSETADGARGKGKKKDEAAALGPHRYNLRKQPAASGAGIMTPASAGELADDEQEGVKTRKVLDEKVSPISDRSDTESVAPSTPSKPKGAKRGPKPKNAGAKAKSKK